MRTPLHADGMRPWPAGRTTDDSSLADDLPRFKTRPPWLIFLAKHFAPRNHERYLLQGIELTEEERASIRAMPRQRPWWLAFLWRQFHRVFPEPQD
jgi:hypothetical protein